MLVPKAIKGSKESSSRASGRSPVVMLPEMVLVSPHSNRHEVNPALALKLLRDIEQSVLVCQAELRRVVSAIDTLHAQGPMVDGWLDSSLGTVACSAPANHRVAQGVQTCTETTLLRHGDADALMQYVEALESHELENKPFAAAVVENEADCLIEAQYRLCWLDDEGKVCSQACPPEQMAVVSTAIARYQKCKQLLAKRQVLEARLQAAVDGLTGVRNAAQRSS